MGLTLEHKLSYDSSSYSTKKGPWFVIQQTMELKQEQIGSSNDPKVILIWNWYRLFPTKDNKRIKY